MSDLKTFNEFLRDEKKPKTSSSLMEESTIVKHKASRLLPRVFSISLPPKVAGTKRNMIVRQFGDRKYTRTHLLWHLLFKGGTMIEWFILERELEFQLREDLLFEKSTLLFGILFESSNTRKRLSNWTSRTKSLFKKFKSLKPKKDSRFFGQYDTFLSMLLSEMKIPSKAESTKSIYSYSEETRNIIPPTPVNFIGVGYKDKGTLGTEPKVDPVAPIDFQPENDLDLSFFKDSWINLKNEFFSD